MALTPRFHELINELDLPEAAWHLGCTNVSAEHHDTQEEIDAGQARILELLTNQSGCVAQILVGIERELQAIEPIDSLLKRRQETVLQQWKNPIGDETSRSEYVATIQMISRRHILEKTKKRAELILAGGFQVIQGGASEIPGSDRRNRLRIKKTEALKDVA